MKCLYKLVSFIICIWCVLGNTVSITAEEWGGTKEVCLELNGSGVIFAASPDESAASKGLQQWQAWSNSSTAMMFQYDISGLPQGLEIVSAQWKSFTYDSYSWTGEFRRFECEQNIDKTITFNTAKSIYGYNRYEWPFLTKKFISEDYQQVQRNDSDEKSPLLTVDMTQAVKSARNAGLTKFNFSVVQKDGVKGVLIPMGWTPNPQLIITLGSSVCADMYTTTRYTDWLLNYHPTSLQQIAAGIIGGEAGQAGQAIAVSPFDHKIMVCGTDQNGVWRSEDGGNTWINSSDGLMTIGVSDLFFDPTNDNIVYAMGTCATSIEKSRRSQYPGIYRSIDKGKTWELVKKLPVIQNPGRYFQAGDVDENGNCPIYAGTNSEGILSGVYVSYDSGETWESCGLDTQIIHDMYADGDFLAASTTNGLYLSSDGGKHWNKTAQDAVFSKWKMKSCVADPFDKKHLFVIDSKMLFESTDGGENWNKINMAVDMGVESLRYLDVMENPNQNDSYILYVGTSKPGPSVRYSLDEGKTFNKPDINTELSFMTDNIGYKAEPIEICRSNNTVFAFLDGDIYKSTDGGFNYYPSESRYSGMRANDFVFDATDDAYLGIAQTDRGFIQTVSGDTLSEYRAFDYDIVLSAGRFDSARTVWAAERNPSDKNHIIICIGSIGTDRKGMLRQSKDNGKTWQDISEAQSHTAELGNINRIYFHPENPDTIYAGILKSTDGGKTWFVLDKIVSTMAPSNGDVVYSVEDSVIYKSVDGGTEWNVFASGIKSLQRCTVDINNPDKIYVGTFSAGLYIIDSENGITHITEQNGLIKSEGILNIKEIAQNPKNSEHLVCGGANNYTFAKSAGLFESFDGGETWVNVEGLPGSADIWTLEFHPDLPKVYIGTSAGTFVYEWEKNTD